MASAKILLGALVALFLVAYVFFIYTNTQTALNYGNSTGTSVRNITQQALINVVSIQLTDPPQVPAGTQALVVAYSGVQVHLNGTSNSTWYSGKGSGSLNLLSLVNLTQTIAAANTPPNAIIDQVRFNVTSATISINNTISNVTLPYKVLNAKVTGNSQSSNATSVVVQLSPTVATIFTNTSTVFVMVPSLRAVVVPTPVANGNVSVHVGANSQLTPELRQQFRQIIPNISISSASVSVSPSGTAHLLLTVQNNFNKTIFLQRIGIAGNESVNVNNTFIQNQAQQMINNISAKAQASPYCSPSATTAPASINVCPGGSTLNTTTKLCICPAGQQLNAHNICQPISALSTGSCPDGSVYNPATSACACPAKFGFNSNGVCTYGLTTGPLNFTNAISPLNCTSGFYPDYVSNKCLPIPTTTIRQTTTIVQCPSFYYYNGKQCAPITISPACAPNFPGSSTYYVCSGTSVNPNICPSGYVFSNNQCILTNQATNSLSTRTTTIPTTTVPSNTVKTNSTQTTTATSQTTTVPGSTNSNSISGSSTSVSTTIQTTSTTPTTSVVSTASATTFTLGISINPTGAGSTSPPVGLNTYPAGTSITLKATANSGYAFTGWTGSGAGSYTGTLANPTIKLNNSIGELANFVVANSVGTHVPAQTFQQPSSASSAGTSFHCTAASGVLSCAILSGGPGGGQCTYNFATGVFSCSATSGGQSQSINARCSFANNALSCQNGQFTCLYTNSTGVLSCRSSQAHVSSTSGGSSVSNAGGSSSGSFNQSGSDITLGVKSAVEPFTARFSVGGVNLALNKTICTSAGIANLKLLLTSQLLQIANRAKGEYSRQALQMFSISSSGQLSIPSSTTQFSQSGITLQPGQSITLRYDGPLTIAQAGFTFVPIAGTVYKVGAESQEGARSFLNVTAQSSST